MGGGSAGGAGGSGDVIDSGVVVGRLTKGVTDSKHITAAAIIPPATNILTINNAAPSTLALNINNGKILTLASDGTHSVNFWADVVFYYDGVNKYSLEFDVQTKLVLRENTTTLFTGGGTIALGGYTLTVPATGTAVLLPAAPAAYTLTNVTPDRAYDANSTSLDEIADTLGTLIADLKALGLVG